MKRSEAPYWLEVAKAVAVQLAAYDMHNEAQPKRIAQVAADIADALYDEFELRDAADEKIAEAEREKKFEEFKARWPKGTRVTVSIGNSVLRRGAPVEDWRRGEQHEQHALRVSGAWFEESWCTIAEEPQP